MILLVLKFREKYLKLLKNCIGSNKCIGLTYIKNEFFQKHLICNMWVEVLESPPNLNWQGIVVSFMNYYIANLS
jgi:hypothetical protein